MKPTAFVLVASLAAAPAVAAPCHTGYAPAYGHGGYQQQYVTPAVGVVVPLYGAAYTGGGGDQTAEILLRILERLEAIDAKLSAGGGSVGTLNQRADPVQIVRANCAACHTAGAADAKGGGFELFNAKGEPIKLSRPDREAITKRVANGTMPPPTRPKLSQADRDTLLSALKDPAPKVGPAPKEVLAAPKK